MAAVLLVAVLLAVDDFVASPLASSLGRERTAASATELLTAVVEQGHHHHQNLLLLLTKIVNDEITMTSQYFDNKWWLVSRFYQCYQI